MLAIWVGFAAGALHVLSGPDHLAAVAPLSVARRVRHWAVGARWGLGHAAGVLAVGAAALAARGAFDVGALPPWGEKPVGIALVLLGLWGLRRARSRWLHEHEHEPGGPVHVHVHAHEGGVERAHAAPGHAGEHAAAEHAGARSASAHHHGHAAFWIGTLHGFAGSAHLLGVLPAIALPSRADALLYLAGFGAGTVAAMAAFAQGVGLAAARLASIARGGERAYRLLLGGASATAVLVGAVWILSA